MVRCDRCNMGQYHLSWVFIADSLNQIFLHISISKHLLSYIFVTLEQLKFSSYHSLHIRDNHNPCICYAVIMPVVYRSCCSWAAQVDLGGVTKAEMRQKIFTYKLLEHLQ